MFSNHEYSPIFEYGLIFRTIWKLLSSQESERALSVAQDETLKKSSMICNLKLSKTLNLG